MPRNSKSHALLSDAALGSLQGLGQRLREARLRRNWTQAMTAAKSGLSESSIKKVEAGSAHITVAAYLALLDIYGMPAAFDAAFAAGQDTLGEALASSQQRRRARGERAPASGDEWEF
ncbi:MAG: helix-turn-helix transcriptional regulator [Pseudomonadota bacterium]